MNRLSKRLVVTLAAGTAIALPIAVVLSQGSGRPGPAPLFTPVQLANGLAFNQGAAAPYLAVFDRPEVPMTGRLLAVERSVDAALRANPELAGKFASDIQSGSVVRVAVALRVLGGLTRTAFGDEFGRAGGRRMMAWAGKTPEDVSLVVAADDPGGSCSTCVVNTPPATVPVAPPTYSTVPVAPPTYTPVNTPPATVTSELVMSLSYLMAEPYRSARADLQGMAETIPVVAVSLDAH